MSSSSSPADHSLPLLRELEYATRDGVFDKPELFFRGGGVFVFRALLGGLDGGVRGLEDVDASDLRYSSQHW